MCFLISYYLANYRSYLHTCGWCGWRK